VAEQEWGSEGGASSGVEGQRHWRHGIQPTTLSGTGNEYQPKCGDALQMGTKGRYGSFHLWKNIWVAGKTV